MFIMSRYLLFSAVQHVRAVTGIYGYKNVCKSLVFKNYFTVKKSHFHMLSWIPCFVMTVSDYYL